MKIGFLVTEQLAGRGGLERVLIEIFKHLSSQGVDCRLFLTNPPLDINFLNNFKNVHINRHKIPKILQKKHFLRPNLLRNFYKKKSDSAFLEEIANDNLDTLLFLNINKNTLRLKKKIALFKKNNPITQIVAYPHGSLLKEINEKQNSFIELLNIFDFFLSISDGITKELINASTDIKVHTIYNPISNAPLIPRPKDDVTKFIYIGRVEDRSKRVYELVNVISKIKGNWTLDIIGDGGSSKENMESLKTLVAEKGLDKNITFHGWQDDPWSVVNEASVLLLHSTREGFGLVLAEAMTRGIPCLSADCPTGPSTIIENEKNGWLYAINDEDILHKIVQDIVNKKIDLPNQALVKKSVEKYSSSRVINNFISAINCDKIKINKY